MEEVKKTDDYTIIKKRNGRYGVRNTAGKWINADEKAKILAAEGLIKLSEPKKVEEPAVEEEAATEEAAE
jgi:hypothetical protein